MAIKHQFTMFCNYHIVNANGQPSYIDNFSDITVSTIPARFSWHVGIGFGAEKGDPLRVEFEGPDGKVRAVLHEGIVGEGGAGDEDLEEGRPTFGLFHHPMISFQFDAEGTYAIVLRQGKKLIHRRAFNVSIKVAQGGEAAHATGAESG